MLKSAQTTMFKIRVEKRKNLKIPITSHWIAELCFNGKKKVGCSVIPACEAGGMIGETVALADHKPVKPDFKSTHRVDRNGRNVEKCCAFWLEEFFTASQQNNVVLKVLRS